MRTWIYSLSFLFLFSTCKSRKRDLVQVQLQVTSTQQYCGGAVPSEEILAELSKARIMSDSTVYLAQPGMGLHEVTPIKLDKQGTAKLKLLPGTYDLFFYNIPEAVKANEPHMHDSNQDPEQKGAPGTPPCPQDWKLMVSQQFEVIPGIKDITINLFRICDPCLEPRP